MALQQSEVEINEPVESDESDPGLHEGTSAENEVKVVAKTVEDSSRGDAVRSQVGSDRRGFQQNRNRATCVHDFKLQEDKDPLAIAVAQRFMRKDSWPIDTFEDNDEEGQRGKWVQWAKRFQAVCAMVPGLTQDAGKQILMTKGGGKMWDILGGRQITQMTFCELWQLIDSHYAVLGNPDTEIRKFHEMKQYDRENFAKFVNRLREQAIRAEMTPDKEEDEMRTALLERSLVGTQLAYEMKLNNLDANGLVMIGVECSLKLERDREQVQLVMQQEEAMRQQVQAIARQEAKQQPRYSGTDTNYPKKRGWDDDRQQKRVRPAMSCRSCGKPHQGPCAAKPSEKLCWKCQKPGHFAVSCKSNDSRNENKRPTQSQIQQVTEDNWD